MPKSSVTEASDSASSTKKETDWTSLANGGLWGENSHADFSVPKVTSDDDSSVDAAKDTPEPEKKKDDAVSEMTRLLMSNSLLQKQKKGSKARHTMVSIKLHRGAPTYL